MWNILIIDDDEVDREFTRRSLESLNRPIHFHEAADGRTALEAITENTFDCALLDFRLPDMDGLSVLSKILDGSDRLPFPIVMMTGDGNEEVAVEAMKQGVYDYVVKGSAHAAGSLVESVSSAINHWTLVRAKERAEEALEHKAAELVIAKAAAEKANRAKSEFLAAMSHDLRTPLNAIMGFSDMIRMQTFGPLGDEHYLDYAKDIYNSGELLISLINDILDLSKVEAGKYDLVEEALNLPALIQTCCHQVEKMATMAELDLVMDIADDLTPLMGDKRVLTQILNNLLSNAIKFTPPGGTVKLTAKVDLDDATVISIEDTGIGMTEDGIHQAMQPFEQVDTDHSRAHDGTGLGLPLCASFMQLHGGDISVDSQIDIGTTVSVRFPPHRTISS